MEQFVDMMFTNYRINNGPTEISIEISAGFLTFRSFYMMMNSVL